MGTLAVALTAIFVIIGIYLLFALAVTFTLIVTLSKLFVSIVNCFSKEETAMENKSVGALK